MADGNHVPVTVQGTLNYAYPLVMIGQDTYNPQTSINNGFWYLVVDLTSLSIAANTVSTAGSNVPSDIAQYANNPQSLLIFTTVTLNMMSLPQGALYQFLQVAGSGYELARAEQIAEQLGSGSVSGIGYILAATMVQDNVGFEE